MARFRLAGVFAWTLSVPFAMWALIRTFGLDGGYPLEAVMPFTPYAAAASMIPIAFAFSMRRWILVGVAALSAICLSANVLPREVHSETVGAAGRQTVGVLAANVHGGGANPISFVQLVDELHPDIVTVEEFTPRFARELADAGLGSRLRFHVLEAAPGPRGTAIYSRFRLRRLPSLGFRTRMARAEAMLPNGRRLRIVAVHPFPPIDQSLSTEWEKVLSTLPSGGQGVAELLAGDFNATLDQDPFRKLVDRGYQDAGQTAGKGLDATFPANGGFLPPPITIDHILADERWGVVQYEVKALRGSDHRAVFSELAAPNR